MHWYKIHLYLVKQKYIMLGVFSALSKVQISAAKPLKCNEFNSLTDQDDNADVYLWVRMSSPT